MSEAAGFVLSDGTQVRPQVPFFIAGSGRCGTTLLRRLLIEQAHVVIPPENYLLAVSPRLMVMAQDDWAAFCRLVLTNLVKHSGNWADFGIDAAAALPLFAAIPPEHRTVANFWHAFHALYARHIGRPSKTRWGDKTPSSVDALPEIVEIFPDARFIFMIRDVFDMAYSYGSMATAGRAGDYLGGARRWVEANSKLLVFHEHFAAQSIIMRYETLVLSANSEMARAMAHLGIAFSAVDALTAAEARDMAAQPDLRNVLHDVHRDSIGKGRTILTDETKAAISAIAGPLQTRLGYEPFGKVS
ncbi:MAG TPA: sulfotransferase [Acetobacteraceae bacterium]|nr:sulfotransferase [Acetobacteraceae bacterium]